MNSNLQAVVAKLRYSMSLSMKFNLENKTEVVATEQRLVKLIILKIFPKLYSHEFSSAGTNVDLFTGMKSNLLFNLCK